LRSVCSSSGVNAIAVDALGALGGLDILVNNAGGTRGFPQGTASIPDEEWQAAFALNLFSAIRLTNALLPALRESKAGAIVNISSTAATMPFPMFAHYCVAKGALDTYSRTLAVDLAPSGIRVNVVSPGPVTTPGGDEVRKTFSDALGAPADVVLHYVPLGCFGTTNDVAEVVALLTRTAGRG
jgi:NAD(P)-dependent dehydrogenase (short-subunit alcohol dehydrogenase family)